MKKAIKTLNTFLTENNPESAGVKEKEAKASKEKAPKLILLSCPQSMRLLELRKEDIYSVESFGATVMTNEATLDYAVRRLNLPLLCVMGHEGCEALQRAVRAEQATDEEKALYEHIAAGFREKTKKEPQRTLEHIDAEVAAALARYGDLVKRGKLTVVGLYCDETGRLFLTNYNGLKGEEALSYSLPEVESCFFMA
ncbi:MAG TPA: carbonic anhydrase [Clostridiales bacterium]|nr:carbonic anhydrase [Clostridiales bacterium]